MDTSTPSDIAGQTANGPPTQTHRATPNIEINVSGNAAGAVVKDPSDTMCQGTKMSTGDFNQASENRMIPNTRKINIR